ncbi:hypothetical protein ACFQAS_11175 [Halopenitus salinus]|uniref:Uncharacterized protein n=1 Tax=Halopenitus salinus TaxID=1198295 RepID=A0ABD5UTT3_9EURY
MVGGSTDSGTMLWIERYADRTGVAALSDRLRMRRFAAHLFVTIVWAIDHLVGLAVGVVQATPIALAGNFLEVAGLLLAASTATTLARRYRRIARDVATHGTVDDVDSADLDFVDRALRRIDAAALAGVWGSAAEESSAWETNPAPPRLRRGLLACGLLLHAVYLFGLGNVEFVLSAMGPIAGGLAFFVIIPFVYYPILAEFLAVVINVHLTLPARIRNERLLDFEDVSGYGGLRPVGQLIETSGHRYVIGLILYTLITIVTGIRTGAMSGNAELVAVDTLYLAVGTLVGVLLFFYPVFALHWFMANQKDARLHAIATDVADLEGTGTTFPEVNPQSPDVSREYMNHFMNLNVAKQMHEYPVSMQRVTSVVVGLIIPYLLDYGADQLIAAA